MPEIDFNEILPVGLQFRKGALVIGNDSTPSILIMDIAGGTGSYGVTQVCYQCYQKDASLYANK
jgi:hypothetical protein